MTIPRQASRLTEHLLPHETRTGRPAAAWGVSVLLFLTFDLLWCGLTTFRSMSFLPTYLFALLGATVVTLPSALMPRRPALQLGVWLILVMFLTANMMYYRTYFTAIPLKAYGMAGNLSGFMGSVADSLAWSDIIMPAEAVAGYIWLRHRRPGPGEPLRWLVAAAGMTVAAWLSSLPYGGPAGHMRFLARQCYYGNCPPAIYTPFGPLALQMADGAKPISAQERDEVTAWLGAHRDRSRAPADTAATHPRSLVMIFLESLETWPIGLTVEGQEVTPNLNRLVADTTSSVTYIPRLVTQVGAGRSIDAQLLLLTGLLPMSGDVAAMNFSDNVYPSLIKAMKSRGPVRSYLLTGDKAAVWNQARFGRALGIDTLVDAPCWEMTEKIGNPAKLADGALFGQIADRMRRGEIFPEGESAYVQIIGYSGHNPWIIPEERRGLRLAGSYPDKYADYLTAMNYVDGALGPLVDYLRSRSDAGSMVIAITGDHEGLAFYRRSLASVAGVDPGEHTPMIIVNSPYPGLYDTEAGQVDAYTTLLDVMGLATYPWRGMGFSIVGPSHPGEAVDRAGEGSADSHLLSARRVSDLIIRHDLLRQYGE